MPEPVRIVLRLLGLILLVAGRICAVLPVSPSPGAELRVLDLRRRR